MLVTGLSWRWVFLVNLPIGAAALAFGLIFLADQEPDHAGRFDVIGFILSGIGFAAVMYGISEGGQSGWGKPNIVAALVVGAVLLVVLLRQQLRAREPLLALRLYGNRLFRSTSAVLFVSTASFLGILYAVALFFQDGLGLSALASGLSTFPEAFGVMLGAQVVSRLLYQPIGPRRIMVGGLAALGATMLLMTTISSRSRAVADAAADVRAGLLHGPRHGAVAGGEHGPDRSGQHRARVHPLQCRPPARQRDGHRRALDRAVRRRLHRDAARRPTPDLTAYHAAFGVAAGFAFVGAVLALSIHDADADSTRAARQPREEPEPAAVG